jgi:predicted Zn finger-like uncharacterized protein
MATKMRADCPKCGKRYSVDDGLLGRRLRCRQCGTTFAVPDQPNAAPAGPEASSRSTTEGGTTRPEGPSPVQPVPDEVPAAIGPYQIRRKLGAGAFGVVYLAYHPFLRREMAVKVLRAAALASPRAVERFEREAQLLARMNHPNVPRVYDAGRHGTEYYLAADYIPGQDLAAAIPDGGLDPQRAVRLTLQMLAGLGYAHGLGITHRDIKPENARLMEDGTLVLTDFGLAGWAAPDAASGADPLKLTQEGVILGTPAYMAPEQAAGLAEQAGPAADLYSAGVVLYEMLTGELPFEGPNMLALLWAKTNTDPTPPSRHRPGLDPQLEAICLKALARRIEDRYRSAEEFAMALECWVGAQARRVAPEAPPAQPAPAPAPSKSQPIPVVPAALPPSKSQPIPVRPTPKPTAPGAIPVAEPVPRRPAVRRRLRCFNHGNTPAAHRCAECGEPFCTACLVTLQKKNVCGPCKDFRLRPLERPPRTSVLAIFALALGLASAPFGLCLTLLQQTIYPAAWAHTILVGLTGLCAAFLALMTGANAFRAIARTAKLRGHVVAAVGMAVAGLGGLWCLWVILAALPACCVY